MLDLYSYPAVFAGLVSLAVIAFWFSADIRRQEQESAERIRLAAESHLLAPALELQVPFSQRVLDPLIKGFFRRVGVLLQRGNIDKLRKELLVAGNPLGLGPLDFIGLRVSVAVLGTAGLALLLWAISKEPIRSILLGCVGALLFAELPNFWLHSLMKRRRQGIQVALADALDMLTVCVDAGLGLESAFMRIGQHWSHALAQEFRRSVMEIGVGVSWQEAMRNMVYRTDVQDLSMLVALMLQADQMGFSVSDTLHDYADDLRIRRRQKAQELARAAPFKMLFPMVFFIMPATFAVVLGPAIPAILEAF